MRSRRWRWIGVGLAVLLGGGFLLNMGEKSANDSPPITNALYLPLQTRFAELPVGTTSSPADPGAEAALNDALQAFRDAPKPSIAVEMVKPQLAAIWQRWPGSAAALDARLFYLQTLPRYGLKANLHALRGEFVEAALRYPARYFSESTLATTQSLAVQYLDALAWRQADTAWGLCLKFRWLAPRVERLVESCRKWSEKAAEGFVAPEAVIALLPAAVRVVELPRARVTPALVSAVRKFVANPYDFEAQGAAVLALQTAGMKNAARQLLGELLEIDPVNTPKIEVALSRIRAPK